MDWLDLLAVQGTLKSPLQHHSSKASIFQHSAFFIVQLSHPHMTTGKTIALTTRIFVGKVMTLVFNMLSRLDITFLPRSKHHLILLLQSPSAVILEPPQIKVIHFWCNFLTMYLLKIIKFKVWPWKNKVLKTITLFHICDLSWYCGVLCYYCLKSNYSGKKFYNVSPGDLIGGHFSTFV